MIPVRTSQSIRTHRHARNYRFLKTMTGPHQLFEAIGLQVHELCRLAQRLDNQFRDALRRGSL